MEILSSRTGQVAYFLRVDKEILWKLKLKDTSEEDRKLVSL